KGAHPVKGAVENAVAVKNDELFHVALRHSYSKYSISQFTPSVKGKVFPFASVGEVRFALFSPNPSCKHP
ncbi:MAG: hypothetical protein IKV50_02590, partial [Clostridia bacterium]|nr:hypothetical protein [Clostridia bacterium]